MTPLGQAADRLRALRLDAWGFEIACDKLGLNKAKRPLTTEHFEPPIKRAKQLDLF
jgi:hypothetical protein